MQGVCHRDLKLENIMFKDENQKEIKIIDFGFATKTHIKTQMFEVIGTPIYLAPEVFPLF
jgi:serine/threonine protein kinase